MSGEGQPLAGCTIVAKNYLPFARTLARSFREHHPDSPFFVLLADRVDGAFDPAAEPFEVIEAERLPNLPDFPVFAFQYGLLEINTAVKPFFLEHLFARRGVERVVYLDPDIRLFAPLAALPPLLDRHSIVLTPHLTAPIDDDYQPSETSILQAGAYNLGFLALARGESTDRLSPGGSGGPTTAASSTSRRGCSSIRSGWTWRPGCSPASTSSPTRPTTSPTGTSTGAASPCLVTGADRG